MRWAFLRLEKGIRETGHPPQNAAFVERGSKGEGEGEALSCCAATSEEKEETRRRDERKPPERRQKGRLLDASIATGSQQRWDGEKEEEDDSGEDPRPGTIPCFVLGG